MTKVTSRLLALLAGAASALACLSGSVLARQATKPENGSAPATPASTPLPVPPPAPAALVASAVLSDRYLTGRFLPDKAIDLVDEAASKLRIEIDSMPTEIDVIERRIRQLEIERLALAKETDVRSIERLDRELGGALPLLQFAHLRRQGRLITYCGRHTSKQRGYLRSCLCKTENIIDEQKYILMLLIAEIFCHRKSRLSNSHTCSRRLVHLSEH